MALRIFKNKGESGAIPLNAENLNYNFQEVLNMVCPVGKVEIFFDNGDHSNYLGFTWERTGTGKAIVGIDSSDTDFSTIGKTGGSKYLQKHKHFVYQYVNGSKFAAVTDYDKTSGAAIAKLASVSGTGSATNTTYKEDTKQGIITDDYAGTGDSGNLQPYQVFAIWKRTA